MVEITSDHPIAKHRHAMPPVRFALVVLVGLFSTSGAMCQQWTRSYVQPRTLPVSATLDQIVTVVNDNSSRVHSLQSTQASLSISGAPTSLKANVAMEPPRRLRMTADAPLAGRELDLGSNEELFWLWVKRNQPPAVFVCRHDQFAMSNARQIMPVEPEWLVEAVGLPHFDTTQLLEGPTPVRGGRLEIRSHQPSIMGNLTKITVVDEWDGTVVEQHLYDPLGHRLATARTGRYKRDPASGAALPRSIDVEWPTTQMAFHLEVTDWVVNSISTDNMAQWTKPAYPGYPDVDLADPNLRFIAPGTAPVGAPAIQATTPPGQVSAPPILAPTSATRFVPVL